MIEVYENLAGSIPGKYIGYVRNGFVYKGGTALSGGTYVGSVKQNGFVFSGGFDGQNGKYIGSARWNVLECIVFKSRINIEHDEDEIRIGHVTLNGILYGDGYILPDFEKVVGIAQNFTWNIDTAHECGAAILLLLSKK